VASTTTSFFSAMEPVLVFALAIPLAFLILGLLINVLFRGMSFRDAASNTGRLVADATEDVSDALFPYHLDDD
jgi:hypothetical protein